MKGSEQVKKQSKHRWKVVKKSNRNSIIIDNRSPYCLTYLPDTIVTAPQGTIGIMTFETKHQAESWWGTRYDNYLIIKVIPMGRGRRPERISIEVVTRMLRRFYNKDEDKFSYGVPTMSPPEGTLCYPAVQVID